MTSKLMQYVYWHFVAFPTIWTFFFLYAKITEERKSPAITKQIVQKIGIHKFGLLDSVLFHY